MKQLRDIFPEFAMDAEAQQVVTISLDKEVFIYFETQANCRIQPQISYYVHKYYDMYLKFHSRVLGFKL